jgi:hypothetical protein
VTATRAGDFVRDLRIVSSTAAWDSANADSGLRWFGRQRPLESRNGRILQQVSAMGTKEDQEF